MLFLDDDVVNRGFCVETAWFLRPVAMRNDSEIYVKHHQHDFDEVLAVFGSDPKDPHNLNVKLEVWLEDKKHLISNNFLNHYPRGLQHGPLRVNKMGVLIFACGKTRKYQ
jgi:hypothetical protein